MLAEDGEKWSVGEAMIEVVGGVTSKSRIERDGATREAVEVSSIPDVASR